MINGHKVSVATAKLYTELVELGGFELEEVVDKIMKIDSLEPAEALLVAILIGGELNSGTSVEDK